MPVSCFAVGGEVSGYLILSSNLHLFLAFRFLPCLFSKGLKVKDTDCKWKINEAFVLHSIYLTEMLLVLTWLDRGEKKSFSLVIPTHSTLPAGASSGRNRTGERRMEGRKLRHNWVSSNAFSPPMSSFQPTLEGRCVRSSQKR